MDVYLGSSSVGSFTAQSHGPGDRLRYNGSGIRQNVKVSDLASEAFAPPNLISQRLVEDAFRAFAL